MKILLYLLLLSIIYSTSYSVEIPDDLSPIENNSEILYSYEFEEPPELINKIDDNRIVIGTKLYEAIEIFIYDHKLKETKSIGEVDITRSEFIDSNYIEDGNLIIIMFGVVRLGLLRSGDMYKRKIIYDLENQKLVDNILIYLYQNSEYDFTEIQKELKLTKIDSSLTVIKIINYLEESGISPNTIPYASVTISLDNTEDAWLSFYPDSKGDNLILVPGIMVDGKYLKSIKYLKMDEIENFNVPFVSIRNDTVLFVTSWFNPNEKKYYISFNNLDSNGNLQKKSKRSSP